uniref:Uncharacterized protein n=1 Tax=Panagrolaimus superbus TaxID=310955 RepID=A0A914XTC0_9BILA
MKFINFVVVLFFITIVNGIYLNPYSYGSYDPAAESPEYYNYYARYYNPNPHNPYAPYPTYMKPGVFRLPRMYQIDPAWAPYYPPNRFETLPQAQVNHQSSGYNNDPRNSPSYEGGQGCMECGGDDQPRNPPPPIEGGCVACGGDGEPIDTENDFERLPLDRINNSPDSDSNGLPASNSNFYRQKRRYIRHF